MKISNHDEQWNNSLVVAFFRSSWALQKWHSRVIIEEANDMKYVIWLISIPTQDLRFHQRLISDCMNNQG